MERLNKEYNININDFFVVKYGSVDRNNPQIVYITGKTWIKPTKDIDYTKEIEYVKNKFKKNIKNKISKNDFLDNKFVCDISVNTASIIVGKKNYLSFDVFIKQKNNNILQLKEIGEKIRNDFQYIIGELYDDFKYYDFKLTKGK